jgi:hypothetical protein
MKARGADRHWGAHAPSRVVFGALAEDFFRAVFPPRMQNVSGEGAGRARALPDACAAPQKLAINFVLND